MKRAVIIVLDSAGIGELPDAAKYGDEGSNTFVNIKKSRPDMDLKNMCSLGLGNIDEKILTFLEKSKIPSAVSEKWQKPPMERTQQQVIGK